jgi:hypothetical protein
VARVDRFTPGRGSRRRRRRERAVSMVEFALLAPFALLLLFGIVVTGIVVTNLIQLNNITRDGARMAAICGSSTGPVPDGSGRACNDVSIKSYITSRLQAIAAGAVVPSITVFSGSQTYPTISACQPGRTLEVDASYSQPLYLPLVGHFLGDSGGNSRTLYAQAQATCER